MPVQRFKFEPPQRPRRRNVIVRLSFDAPVGGTRTGTAPASVRTNETPFAKNLVLVSDQVLPRSVTTRWSADALGPDPFIPVYAGWSADETGIGIPLLVGPATSSNSTYEPFWSSVTGFALWSKASVSATASTASNLGAIIDTSSTGSHTLYGAQAYDADNERNIFIITGGRPWNPVFFYYGATGTAYGEPVAGSLTAGSITTSFGTPLYPKFCAYFNERTVWYGFDTDGQDKKVVWSKNGGSVAQADLGAAGGAGSQTLTARGQPQALIADGDRLLLFTDQEVWEGRSRLDDFVFDFSPIVNHTGAMPGSVVHTDLGTAFVGKGFQPYILQGANLIPLGGGIKDYLYDQMGANTQLGISDATTRPFFSSKYLPSRGLWVLAFGFNGSFREMLFIYLNKLSRDGESVVAPWFLQTGGEGGGGNNSSLNGYDMTVTSNPNMASTAPAPYSYDQHLVWFPTTSSEIARALPMNPYQVGGATSADFGSTNTFEALFSSPVLRASGDKEAFEMIQEVAVDYTALSNASLGVWFTNDHGTTLESLGTFSITVPSGASSHKSQSGTAVLPVTPHNARNAQIVFRTLQHSSLAVNRYQITLRSYLGRRPY